MCLRQQLQVLRMICCQAHVACHDLYAGKINPVELCTACWLCQIESQLAQPKHATVHAAYWHRSVGGVQGIHAPPAEFITQQMDSVLEDIGASVVKTGMLPNAKVMLC